MTDYADLVKELSDGMLLCSRSSINGCGDCGLHSNILNEAADAIERLVKELHEAREDEKASGKAYDEVLETKEKLRRERDEARADRDRISNYSDTLFHRAVDAESQVERLTKERDEARAERDDDEAIWPEWAQQILERLRDLGYQYEAEEEIQLPDDFIAHVEGWLQATEDRYKARAEAAEAEVARLREALTSFIAYANGQPSRLMGVGVGAQSIEASLKSNGHLVSKYALQELEAALEAKHD